MHHSLTPTQRAQLRAELSRTYHLQLVEIDRQIRELRERTPPLPIAEFTRRYHALEEYRQTLKRTYEQDRARLDD